MAPGFKRYERYKVHEAASKAKELSILQHAFPESHLDELPFLWNSGYLADQQATVRVDRQGNLIMPTAPISKPRARAGVSARLNVSELKI